MRFQALHFWHRYLGLAAALFVMLLAFTGLLIQHSDQLDLDQRYLTGHVLNQIYGIQPDPVISYATENYWVSLCGKTLYLGVVPLTGKFNDLQGAEETLQGIAITVDHSLLLITPEGEILDQLTTDNGLQEQILGLSISVNNTLVVRGRNTYWEADGELINWTPYKGPHPIWSAPKETPSDLRQNIQEQSLNKEINWERFLLDMHSGRLFGQYGIYFMDAAAIAMLLLAISGFWLWLQRRV